VRSLAALNLKCGAMSYYVPQVYTSDIIYVS